MYLLINKTNFKTKQATPTIQERFWRALTTYNNPIPLINRGGLSASAVRTRVPHLCKDVWSCEALLDGEKVVNC